MEKMIELGQEANESDRSIINHIKNKLPEPLRRFMPIGIKNIPEFRLIVHEKIKSPTL